MESYESEVQVIEKPDADPGELLHTSCSLCREEEHLKAVCGHDLENEVIYPVGQAPDMMRCIVCEDIIETTGMCGRGHYIMRGIW